MAENVSITPGVGDSIAADDIGGVKHQRVKLTLGNDGVNDGDVSASNPLPIGAPPSLPLPAGAATEATLLLKATEATLLTVKSDTASIITALGLLATEATLAGIAAFDFATEATLVTIKSDTAKLDVNLSTRASEATLATRASEATVANLLTELEFETRVGEVQVTPTANTVLARLKDIVTQMTTQVRGLFDSAGNAISSISIFSERRLLVGSMEWRVRLTDEGRMYSTVLSAFTAATGGAENPMIHIDNPGGSGKTVLFDKSFFAAFTNFVRILFVYSPTVTANGTAMTIQNQKPGSPASAINVYSGPTVTAATGTRIGEFKCGPSAGTDVIPHDFCFQLAPGQKLVLMALPDGNNRLISTTLRWAEV
jgi:hypothetical protein